MIQTLSTVMEQCLRVHILVWVLLQDISDLILLPEKFLQFDWLRAVVFQFNLKYLHAKITNLLRVVV